jgi:hypothetical protein
MLLRFLHSLCSCTLCALKLFTLLCFLCSLCSCTLALYVNSMFLCSHLLLCFVLLLWSQMLFLLALELYAPISSYILFPLLLCKRKNSQVQAHHWVFCKNPSNFWRAPKSLVSPKLGLSHSSCGISGTRGTLPASSIKGGERGVLKAPGLD